MLWQRLLSGALLSSATVSGLLIVLMDLATLIVTPILVPLFPDGALLEAMTVQREGPRASEVLIEVKATSICHTDDFTLSGADPKGLFWPLGRGVTTGIGSTCCRAYVLPVRA